MHVGSGPTTQAPTNPNHFPIVPKTAPMKSMMHPDVETLTERTQRARYLAVCKRRAAHVSIRKAVREGKNLETRPVERAQMKVGGFDARFLDHCQRFAAARINDGAARLLRTERRAVE